MKCRICGKEFELKKENLYTAREECTTGLALIAENKEVDLFDAFDCPFCGCQNIVGKRKRTFCEEKVLEDDLNDIKKKIEEAGE